MLDLAAVKIRYEDLSAKNEEHPLNDLLLHLEVPLYSAGFPYGDYSSTSKVYNGPLQNETRTVFWGLGYKLREDNANKYVLIDQNAKS